jgi:ubiquinone/menaquinone biosynthesis C-methylase UbiE
MQNQFELMLELIQCPECRQGELTVARSNVLSCQHCGKRYQVQHGILDLRAEQGSSLAKKVFGRLSAQSYDMFAARSAFRKLYRWQFEDEFAEYTRSVAFLSSDIVCDFGCGTGNYTIQFARNVNRGLAIGIDISWAMLELLIQHVQTNGIKNVIAVCANAKNLPFKNGSLGKVFNGCLHHLFPDTRPSLDETYRCLRQGGVFLGSTFFAARPVLFRIIQRMGALALAARPVIPEVLERELEEVGFRNVVVNPGRIGQLFFGHYYAVKREAR